MTTQTRPRGGFTLLEVLVVLAIMSGMFVAAYGSLSTAIRDSEALEAHADRLEQEQRALAFLTMDFEQLLARPARDSYGDPQPAIGSLPDGGLAMTRNGWANPFDLRARSQVQRVFYVLEDNTLLRRYQLALDANSGTEIVDVKMLEGVDTFVVRYLRLAEGDQYEWLDEWPDAADAGSAPLLQPLPVSVEVDIRFDDGRSLHRYFRVPVNPWLD